MQKKKSLLIKMSLPVVFVLIFIILYCLTDRIISHDSNQKYFQYIKGFYSLEENSLDAVIIGSSKAYSSWIPTYAWNEHGIAVYNYATAAMNLTPVKYLIEEVRKSQPDAQIIINVNSDDLVPMSEIKLHHLTDNMPFSITKLQLINGTTSYFEDYNHIDALEYVFPIIRYHSRWKELSVKDLNRKLDGTLGASYYSLYLKKSKNYDGSLSTSEIIGEIPEDRIAILEDLLTYCEKEEVDPLFVCFPYCELTDEEMAYSNAIMSYIANRGFDTLNMKIQAEEFGIDDMGDFYNTHHVNVHGGIKCTEYLANYLIANYGFSDKRGNDKYAQWDEAYSIYQSKIAPYVFDVEYDYDHREYSLKRPRNLKAKIDDGNIRIFWEDRGADGYVIYMREDSKHEWKRIGETENLLEYIIEGTENKDAKFTAIPYAIKDGECYYGDFKYTGTGVKNK